MESENSKDKFYQNVHGTTISEVLCVILIAHCCTLIVMIADDIFPKLSHPCNSECAARTCKLVQNGKYLFFVKDFLIIVMTLMCTITVFSDESHLVMTVMSIGILIFTFYKVKCTNSLNYECLRKILNTRLRDEKTSFLTCGRSIISIFTVLSILAVDFTIFPRRFAKTQTQGYSLMDVGVGLFVMSNALVVNTNKIRKEGFKKMFIGSLVLFFLGLVRFYTTNKVNYHVIEMEYGIHWNFFFTLSTVKLLTFCVLKYSNLSPLKAALVLGAVHEFLLFFKFREYVLTYKVPKR